MVSKLFIPDPGSGCWLSPIPDPGSRGQKGTQSRIPDPDPQHCLKLRLYNFLIFRGRAELETDWNPRSQDFCGRDDQLQGWAGGQSFLYQVTVGGCQYKVPYVGITIFMAGLEARLSSTKSQLEAANTRYRMLGLQDPWLGWRQAVFRIHDILGPDPIRRSMPLTIGSGSGSGSCYFRHWH